MRNLLRTYGRPTEFIFEGIIFHFGNIMEGNCIRQTENRQAKGEYSPSRAWVRNSFRTVGRHQWVMGHGSWEDCPLKFIARGWLDLPVNIHTNTHYLSGTGIAINKEIG